MTPIHGKADARNCAIREFTADGVSVGRCWHYLGYTNVCPRHGDVAAVQQHFVETGELTNDPQEMRRRATIRPADTSKSGGDS